jgi:hypothetical protein
MAIDSGDAERESPRPAPTRPGRIYDGLTLEMPNAKFKMENAAACDTEMAERSSRALLDCEFAFLNFAF